MTIAEKILFTVAMLVPMTLMAMLLFPQTRELAEYCFHIMLICILISMLVTSLVCAIGLFVCIWTH